MNKNKIINGCDKVMRFSFYCLIYFIPISIALVEIFSTLALVSFLVKRSFVFVTNLQKRKKRSFSGDFKVFSKSYKPLKTHLSWPIVIFLLMNLLSVVFSQDFGLSLKGFFFKLMQGVFIYFTFIECMKKKGHLRFFISVYLISCTLVGFNGLAQIWTGKGFIHGHLMTEGGRIISSLKHPNDFGTYLITALPIVFSLFACLSYSWKKARISDTEYLNIKKYFHPRLFHILMTFLFFLLMICLGFTFSRGAWIGLFGGLLFFGLKEKKALPTIIVVVVAFLIVFIPKMETSRNVSFISDNVQAQQDDLASAVEKMKTKVAKKNEISKVEKDEIETVPVSEYTREWIKITRNRFGGMGRDYYWQEAFAIIRDYPTFGSGINTYSKMGERYRISWGGYPHNCYLQMAAEIGFIGISAFFWLIFNFYKSFCEQYHAITDKCLRYVAVGFVGGLTAFLVHSFFDTNLYSVQLANLFWLILAAGVALQNIALSDNKF